eukprot:gene21160-61225_t
MLKGPAYFDQRASWNVVNEGTQELADGAAVRGEVDNGGALTAASSQLFARVVNRGSIRVAADAAGPGPHTSSLGRLSVWDGALDSRPRSQLSVDAAQLFVRQHRSDRGRVRLTRGGQLNYVLNGDLGSHGYEYATWSPCWAAAHGADAPEGWAVGCDTTPGAGDGGAWARAAGERFQFRGSSVTGDGSGAVVFAGPLTLDGAAALHMSDVRVHAVAEDGAPP